MPEIIQSVTLDGASPFTLAQGSYGWASRYLVTAGAFNSDPDTTYRITITLTDTLWQILALTLDDVNIATTIRDSDDGAVRRINLLTLSDGGTDLTLFDTRVDFIRGYAGASNTLTLGARSVSSVELLGGDDAVAGGRGAIRTVTLGAGDDRFEAGRGTVTFLDLGDGDDTLVVGAGGNVRSAILDTGADTVTLTGDGRIESLRGYGDATVTLRDTARIEQAFLNGDRVRVTIADDARIFQLKTGEGVNRIATGDGFLESYFNFNGTNIVTIGAGGAGQILFAGSDGTQRVVGDGFIGALQVLDAARATVTLNAGADVVRTGDANDAVTARGEAFVGVIRTLGGNDRVTLGPGGANLVDLGRGNDTLRIVAMDPDRALTVAGGGDTDTLDLSRIGQAVFVDLSRVGTFQNIGRSDGLPVGAPGVIGYVAISGVEALIGTAFADRLTGREGAEALTGGAGDDTLAGLGGDDTLAGGAGDDRLTGFAGADTFAFGRNGGTDTITDFTPGEDVIAIDGVGRLNGIAFSAAGTADAPAVRLAAQGTTIVVEGVTLAEMRDADNFLF